MNRRGGVWACLALSAVASCAACADHFRNIGAGLEHVRSLVQKLDCRDGAPARILVDLHCQEGICGVTCAPDRWKVQ